MYNCFYNTMSNFSKPIIKQIGKNYGSTLFKGINTI